MSIFKRKAKSDSAEIAQALLNEFVENTTFDDRPKLALSADIEPRYRAKSRMYRIAIVLMALMAQEQKNRKFAQVRENFEILVFPGSQAKSLRFIGSVKSAMQNLSELFFPADKPREMSWAKAWLDDIGVIEINPIDLSLFAMRWMDSYMMIVKVLGDVKPS